MKGIMISAPNSNSGKTVITAALLYSLKKKALIFPLLRQAPIRLTAKYWKSFQAKEPETLTPL